MIPQLLTKEEPAEASEFKPSSCLNFEYHYPVLPEGLIPRFIVRTYTLSSAQPRWRYGVILTFEMNRALLKGDVQERKVSVSVSGPLNQRRSLLAIIRAEMEFIHAQITHLAPKAMVPLPDYPHIAIEYRTLRTFNETGHTKIPLVVGNQVSTYDVGALLSGVDSVVQERGEFLRDRYGVRLFVSYAHKDERLRAELETHLKILHRTGLIDKWDDRLIEPSDEWKEAIDENLNAADIILLLVSADFLNSDFCWDQEMERALERHTAGEAVAIPVIIRDCDWKGAKFAKLQALPKEGKAVTLWPDRDSAWHNIAEGIKKVAERIQKKRRTSLLDPI